jgi:hypothetical protein
MSFNAVKRRNADRRTITLTLQELKDTERFCRDKGGRAMKVALSASTQKASE